jgi:hypothetical protein
VSIFIDDKDLLEMLPGKTAQTAEGLLHRHFGKEGGDTGVHQASGTVGRIGEKLSKLL